LVMSTSVDPPGAVAPPEAPPRTRRLGQPTPPRIALAQHRTILSSLCIMNKWTQSELFCLLYTQLYFHICFKRSHNAAEIFLA
jgi:hypothetical protein